MPPHGPGQMSPRGPSQHVQVRGQSVYLGFVVGLRTRSVPFRLGLRLCMHGGGGVGTVRGCRERGERPLHLPLVVLRISSAGLGQSTTPLPCCSCWR